MAENFREFNSGGNADFKHLFIVHILFIKHNKYTSL